MITSGFFNSVNGDRKYTADQVSSIVGTLIHDGVFQTIGNSFAVEAVGGTVISVGTGRAWFNNIWIFNDSTYSLSMPAPGILPRVDAVVLSIDKNALSRTARIEVISGEPSSSSVDPPRPSMTNNDVLNQYPLAYITRLPSEESITSDVIINTIGTSECPFVSGILDTIDVSELVASWESSFHTWFDNLQHELDSDEIASLQAQINLIKAEIGTVQEFSSDSSVVYSEGNYVTYLEKYYVCVSPTTGGTWDSDAWSETSIFERLDAIENFLEALTTSDIDLSSDVITAFEILGFDPTA